MPKDLALLGMMGVGKSTVAAHLGEALDREVVATDTLVEERAGRSIPEIFGNEGEAVFRTLEREGIADLADGAPPRPRVLDLGGGAVLDDRNVASLRRHAVLVQLTAPLPVLVSRLAEESTGRPLLFGSDLAETLRALVEQRGARYDAVADVTVDADREPAEVASVIVDWAASRPDVLSADERLRTAQP